MSEAEWHRVKDQLKTRWKSGAPVSGETFAQFIRAALRLEGSGRDKLERIAYLWGGFSGSETERAWDLVADEIYAWSLAEIRREARKEPLDEELAIWLLSEADAWSTGHCLSTDVREICRAHPRLQFLMDRARTWSS